MKSIKFASNSGGNPHTVTVHDDGRVVCSCRGYRTPGKCWHWKQVMDGTTVYDSASGTGNGPVTAPPPCPACLAGGVCPTHTAGPWTAPAAPYRAGFIEPMLASALKEGETLSDYTDRAGWVLEEKYDGHRLIIEVREGGSYTAWSRAGNERDLPDHLAAQVALAAPATYDTEEYIPGGTSTDVTDGLRAKELRLAFFDILRVGPVDCMDRPASERRALLEMAMSRIDSPDAFVAPQFPVTQAGLDAIWSRKGEGAIIKRMDRRYSPGKRVLDWIKFKKPYAAEMIVVKFEAGKLGPHSVIIGVDRNGIEVRCKTLNDSWRAEFLINAERFIGLTLCFSHQGMAAKGKYKSAMADHWL